MMLMRRNIKRISRRNKRKLRRLRNKKKRKRLLLKKHPLNQQSKQFLTKLQKKLLSQKPLRRDKLSQQLAAVKLVPMFQQQLRSRPSVRQAKNRISPVLIAELDEAYIKSCEIYT
jgi:hypothetical protein